MARRHGLPRLTVVPASVLLALVLAFLAGCSRAADSGGAAPTGTVATGATSVARPATPSTPATAAAVAEADPFRYCAAVGDIDAPDARYTGPAMPEAVERALLARLNATRLSGAQWRCMGGRVYGCTVGANLPCGEKADTSKTPNTGMTDYCRDNPTAAFIPAFVTGRATVYEWRCASGTPEAGRQLVQPDARGFHSNIWYELAPG